MAALVRVAPLTASTFGGGGAERFPAQEGPQPTLVLTHQFHVILRVAAGENLHARHRAVRIEPQQHVAGPRVADQVVGFGGRGEYITQRFVLGIKNKMPAALDVARRQSLGGRKQPLGQLQGYAGTALRFQPAVLVMNEPGQRDKHSRTPQPQHERFHSKLHAPHYGAGTI